jgi:hypothetical protein
MRVNPPSPVASPPGAMGGDPVRFSRGTLRLLPTGGTLRPLLTGAALLAAFSSAALAYTVTLDPASPRAIYLQVGNGGFTALYCGGTTSPTHTAPNCGPNFGGGTPENNPTINTVSATLAAGVVGNGTAVAMTTNSTAATSYLDGYAFCTVPSQLYIGGFYRTTGATTAAASVTATVPAALTDAAGDRIPFSNIRWTSSGNGDTGAEPFPAGTFVSGGVQTIGSMPSNSWNESCLTFSYLNKTVPAAGTYSGAVLYTMSAP